MSRLAYRGVGGKGQSNIVRGGHEIDEVREFSGRPSTLGVASAVRSVRLWDAALRSFPQLVLSSQPAYTGKRRHLSVQRKGLQARARVSVRNKPVEEAGAA